MPASSRRPGWDVFDQGNLPRHVAVAVTGEMLGSGSGQSRVTPAVYRDVTEHSVYVRPDASGPRRRRRAAGCAHRLGRRRRLLGHPDRHSPPRTPPCLRLDQRAGYRIVGTRLRIGSRHGL